MLTGAVGCHLAVGTAGAQRLHPLRVFGRLHTPGYDRSTRALPGLHRPLGASRFAKSSIRCTATATASSKPTAGDRQWATSISSRSGRQGVVASGRRPKGEQAPAAGDDNGTQELQNQSLADLRQYCSNEGLPSAGKKADLIARIQHHQQEQGENTIWEQEPAATIEPSTAVSAVVRDQIRSQLSVAELRQQCQEFGLPSTGKKTDLLQRIEQHLEEYYDSSLEEVAGDSAAPQTAAAAAEASSDIDIDELIIELEAEFAGNSKQELVAALQNKGLPTDGSKSQLVTRLAEAVAADELSPAAQDFAAVLDQQHPPAAPSNAPADRDWLLADKQQAIFEELLKMGPKRGELVEILADTGQTTPEEETLEDLIERASWVLAEEELLMAEEKVLMEQQEAAGGAAATARKSTAGQEALASSPSSILDGLTATDINKMKVDELKSMLQQLGLSNEGGRYVLRDRLMTMLVVRKAATAGDMDHLLQQLSQMTLTELRSELERRGLSLSGTKAALEMRLAQVLVVEIMGGDAATAALQMQMGTGPEAPEVELLGNPLLEEYDEVETAIVDPPVTVALICGIASATASSRPSSLTAANRLSRISEALATANTLLDALHTAPLDPQQAAAMAAGQAVGAGAPTIPACGITVDVYWADAGGVFYQLPAAGLSSLAPGDVASRAHTLATATFPDADALATHMALESSTYAALSVLPGGALAMSGKLAAACESAGIALAAGAPFEGANKELSGGRDPVLGGRSAVLQELKTLGYPTLPVLEVSRQEILDEAEALAKYVGGVWAEEEEAMLAPDDFEPQSPVDNDDATGGRNISAILRSWNQAATAAVGEPSHDTADASAAASDAQLLQQQQEQKAATAKLPAFVERLASWCTREGMKPQLQVFTLGNAAGGEPLAGARGLQRVVEQLVNVFAQDEGLTSLLVEPLFRKLARWEVVVVSTAEDGPVSLVPAELEHYNVLQQLEDADLALKEWGMLQEGVADEGIGQVLAVLMATEPEHVDTLRLPGLPDPMPGYTLKLHMPPRASTKVTQTIRHAAAKAVAQLGLEKAGLVRVSGWMALMPDWQEVYTPTPEAIKKMPDWDADQLIRMYEDQLAARVTEPLPLVDYYDDEVHMADLSKFDPAVRCPAEGNGEAEVLLGAVELDVPLHTASIAGIQALEVGLGPGGLARHLINLALLRKGSLEPLPPPTPPLTHSSAQWAQATGANDNIDDVVMQLALQKVEERDAEDSVREREAVEAERAAFAALPWDEAVQDVLSGLTAEGMTEEQLAAPAQEPEEWQPEFDSRSQSEINAERDALRAAEDLAARNMRDEGLPHYGDQPIRYDRYDTGEDWRPPAIVAAESQAAGKPVPSIADFQQEESEKLEQNRQQILLGPYSEADRLPDVSDDEVLYYRLLGQDRYKGGVQAALQQSRDWQKESRTQIAVSAQQAAEEAARSGGEITSPLSAAPQGPVSGTAPQDNWPYPSERELVAEVESRRAAPRVWVLMGGDGEDRQRCFRNGANIVAKLQRCQDLQVDAFLLPPAGAGLDEVKRRAALLARRTEWQALGIPLDLYPDSMSDSALVDMAPTELAALSRSLTVLSPHHLARHTVEEAMESAERLAARSRVNYTSATVVERHQLDSQYESQMELEAHYIEGVASSWGGVSAAMLSPPARTLNLEEFILEAGSCGATVVLATDDSLTVSGQLQQLLESAGIGYTGMTADFAFKCSNRLALSKAIDDIVESLTLSAGYSPEDLEAAAEQQSDITSTSLVGLASLTKKVIKTDELLESMERVEDHDVLLEGLFDGWNCKSVVLKPSVHSSGTGNIRIATVEDLVLATKAMRDGAPKVLSNKLSLQPEGVTLPMSLPQLMVVEPWIETDPVGFNGAAAGGDASAAVQWEGKSRWVEVSVGLLGELGSMIALQPTMIAAGGDGSRHQLTPPPERIVPQAAIEAAQGYAVAVADGLGLRSVACVDGFVNVDTGEFIVLDVKPNPPLTDGSPLLQQALVHDPPMLPYQLFRHLARHALLSAEAAAEAADLPGSGGSVYYSPTDAGTAGFSAEDFDFGSNDAGDVFTGSSVAAFGDVGGVEDEDMQGLAAAGWTP